MKVDWLSSIAILLSRLTLGMYVFLAGWGKVFDQGLKEWMEFYNGMRPGWLPEWFAVPYGYFVPWGEMIVGALVVLGLLGRIGALGMTLMLMSFTVALVNKLGVAGGGPGAFHTNFILIALAILLSVMGPGKISLDALVRWSKG